ncbi:MAG TPA: hypothetical protein VIF62_11365 [Labilithrix sp.]|jgi:hypothetical protein
MRARKRGPVSIGAAVATHLFAFAIVRSLPIPAPVVATPIAEPRDAIAIEDLVELPPPPSAPEPAIVRGNIEVTTGNINVTNGKIEVTTRLQERAGDAPTEPGRGTVPTFVAAAPRVAIDGPNPFLASGAPVREPTESEETRGAERRVEAALRQPARDRERELGLGPEGPVLTALGDATSTTTTPVRGRAVFLAIANGAGEVLSIRVAECDGAQRDWAQAATIALGALKGKKLRVPSSATRAEMRIEITSAWKLPSGQDPGADVSVLGLPVAKGEGKDATKVEILNPLPKVEKLKLSKDIEIPIVVWSFTIFGTNGDPANIGAAARRVVHARLLDSKVM